MSILPSGMKLALRKRTQRAPLPLPFFENTVRKWLSMKQKVGHQQTVKFLAPWSWTSWFPELWELNFCAYKSFSLWYFCHSSPNKLRQNFNLLLCSQAQKSPSKYVPKYRWQQLPPGIIVGPKKEEEFHSLLSTFRKTEWKGNDRIMGNFFIPFLASLWFPSFSFWRYVNIF